MKINKVCVSGILAIYSLFSLSNVHAQENDTPLVQTMDEAELYEIQNEYTALQEQLERLNMALEDNEKSYEQIKKELEEIINSYELKVKETDTLKKRVADQEVKAEKIQSNNKVSRYFRYVFGGEESNFLKRVGTGFSEVKSEEQFLKGYLSNKDLLKTNTAYIKEANESIEGLKLELLGNLDVINQQKEEKKFLKIDILEKEKLLQGKINLPVQDTSTFVLETVEDNDVGNYSAGDVDISVVPESSGDFMAPTIGTVISTYGYRNGFNQGVDIIKNTEGEVPIVAVADGTVTKSYFSNTLGSTIHIEHTLNEQKYVSIYTHLDTRVVKAGTKVAKGNFIGTMGNTGVSDDILLHFEMKKKEGEELKSINPLLYIPFSAQTKSE